MSLSENPHETKPLTMSAAHEAMDRQYAVKEGGGLMASIARAWTEIDALRAKVALYEQQEMGVAGKCCHESTVALAAAQLNARTLREALEALGSAFMTVKRQNTPEWMEYAQEAIAKADAILSAPADEAALRQVEREAEARGIRIGANAARDMMQRLIHSPHIGDPDFIDRCVDSVTPKSALGAPETHAKEG